MIPRCLQATENCGLPVYRGLCHRHYRQLASLVRRGKTTMKYSLTTMLAILKEHGCPEPVPEYRFAPPRRWRVDLAWVDKKIALEIEGGIWIGGRHTSGTGFLKDIEKYNELAILGWRLLRCTPKMIASGEALGYLGRALDVGSKLVQEKGCKG